MTTRTNQTAPLTALRAQTKHADSKASILMGTDVAGLGFAVSQVSDGPMAVRICVGLAGLAFAASLCYALAVIFPRFGNAGSILRSLWRAPSESEVLKAFTPDSDNSAVDRLTTIICVKFGYIQRAIVLLVAAALLGVTSIIVGFVA